MLNISVDQSSSDAEVAVLKLEGELDAATYLDVISAARQLADAGTHKVLLDLTDLTYMGSSGLFAIHSMAMVLRGEAPPDPESGWGAIRQLPTETADVVDCLRLLDPQPQVDRVLERTGMKRFYETYTDRAAALESF